jgi:FKBP-type peptidyl-prolyl cis-trans isomerase
MRGYYFKSNNNKKFTDTWHQTKPLSFELEKVWDPNTANNTIRGLDEAVRTMILGEEASFVISSDYAYGSEVHHGFIAKVPPHSDILEVDLITIVRDGVVYNRKNPPRGFLDTGDMWAM